MRFLSLSFSFLRIFRGVKLNEHFLMKRNIRAQLRAEMMIVFNFDGATLISTKFVLIKLRKFLNLHENEESFSCGTWISVDFLSLLMRVHLMTFMVVILVYQLLNLKTFVM